MDLGTDEPAPALHGVLELVEQGSLEIEVLPLAESKKVDSEDKSTFPEGLI